MYQNLSQVPTVTVAKTEKLFVHMSQASQFGGSPVTPFLDMRLHFGPSYSSCLGALSLISLLWLLLLPVHSSVLSMRLISWSFSLTRLLTSSWKSFQPLASRLLHYSCLENSMDRRAWQATYSPWGHEESDTTEQLTHRHTHTVSRPIIDIK